MACTIFYFVYLDIVLEKLYCLHHHTTPYNNENFERTLQNLFIIFTFGFCATSTSSSISKIFPFTDNKIPKQNGKSHQGCRDQKFGDNHLSSLDVESLLQNLALWSQNALLSKNLTESFTKITYGYILNVTTKTDRALPFSNSSFNVNFFKIQ